MKDVSDTQPATPFEKFKELTQRLLAVPKKEIDEKLAEHERKKKQKKQKKR
jgi:hypothetical protein